MDAFSYRSYSPSLESLFLEFIGNPTTPAWKGYLLAVLMFLSAFLQSVWEQHWPGVQEGEPWARGTGLSRFPISSEFI